MVITNFNGVGVGFGFGVGCGFGVGWGFGGSESDRRKSLLPFFKLSGKAVMRLINGETLAVGISYHSVTTWQPPLIFDWTYYVYLFCFVFPAFVRGIAMMAGFSSLAEVISAFSIMFFFGIKNQEKLQHLAIAFGVQCVEN